MASINFSIGSTFSGEGFKQLQNAMATSSKNIKEAARVSTQMVSTLGMMDGAFSKTANAIGGMMSAISSGNPYLIAMQAAMTGIMLYQQKMQEEADKLKEKMDSLAESVKVAHDRLVESVNAETIDNYARLIQECKTLTAEFDRMTKQSEDFVASVNKLDATRDIGKNLDYKIARIQAQNSGASKSTLAKMDLEQTKTEGKQKIKYATQKVNAAIEKRATVQQKQVNADEQISRLVNHQSELKKQLNDFGSLDTEIAKTTTEKLKENEREIEKLIEQKEEYRAEEEKANRAILQAKEELLNTEKQAKLDRLEAKGKLTNAYDQEAREQQEKDKKEEEKKSQEKKAKEQAKSQILAEIEEQERRIEEQKQLDDLRKEANIRATQQILGGNGGGSDGSYRDENGGLHLTSDGRNNALWAAADGSDALRELKSNLTWFALKGIKGSNGELNRRMQNYINSAEFEGKYRKANMTDKAWNEFKKNTAKGGRNLLHSGEYNDIAREAAQGGGSGGGQEQEALQITSPQLATLNGKLDDLLTKLNNLGLE